MRRSGILLRRLIFVQLVLASPAPAHATDLALDAATIARVAHELDGRRFMSVGTSLGTRGVQSVFAQNVYGVPLIITNDGLGSSTVIQIIVSKPDSHIAAVVTNQHVVASPFVSKSGENFVLALFYDPPLAQEQFDGDRISTCLLQKPISMWCRTFQNALRVGVVLGSDPERDLALVGVPDPPIQVRPIATGRLADLRPGADVVVIGHPLGLVWSVTTGIISGVRSNYRMNGQSSAPAMTVIQTQAPTLPGNSGGPLLTDKGDLIGIIFGSPLVPAKTTGEANVSVAAPGLNLAIGVNEVQSFIEHLAQSGSTTR